MWLVILTISLAVAVAGLIYLVSRVKKFSFVKGKLMALLIVVAAAAVLVLLMGFVNTIIVLINLAAIWLICDGLSAIIERISGKKAQVYYAGIAALVITGIYLAFGFYFATSVAEKDYRVTTDKNVSPVKLALIADAHVGTTMSGEEFAGYIEEIGSKNPDALLIAGDLFDDSTGTEDMVRVCEALGNAKTKYGVFYVFGNHDRGYSGNSRGYSAEEFVNKLTENKVTVLKDEAVNIGDDYCIIGREDKGRQDRKSVSKLMETVDSGRYTIVLDHQPSDYDAQAAAGCDLVLSGHTHGGQMFPITYVGEWIGVNDATYGLERRGNTDFIVTSGIGDWEILFKTGCRAEYVMVEVENQY